MPQTLCCVPGCSNRGGHAWPTNPRTSKAWFCAIRRSKWTPKKSSVVCHSHFSLESYVSITTYGSKPGRKQLKRGALPTIFNWSKQATPMAKVRAERATKRLKRFDIKVPDVGNEVIVETTNEDEELLVQAFSSTEEATKSTFTQTPWQSEPPMSIERFKLNDDAIHHYTGLESYSKFVFVLNTLGPAAYHLNYRWRNCQLVSVENQFFMTLIKLRHHRTHYELGLNFDISEFSVGNIVITWINFMYMQWQEMDIWPTRDLVSFYMPEDFANKFPTTRIILDGTECPIKKPKCPIAQQCTFSRYKNRNTAKLVVGISPGGLVTHVPEVYGGSTSDRQFVERSGLMSKCDKGDSIMVDKGMKVQDLFASRDIKVNIPTFLKHGNRFDAKTLARDRKIASKRVHVERVIGLAKTYKVLTQPMNSTEATLASEILFICMMLCNFRTCIVPRNA